MKILSSTNPSPLWNLASYNLPFRPWTSDEYSEYSFETDFESTLALFVCIVFHPLKYKIPNSSQNFFFWFNDILLFLSSKLPSVQKKMIGSTASLQGKKSQILLLIIFTEYRFFFSEFSQIF